MLAALALTGLGLSVAVQPALAADPQLSLKVEQRWQLASSQGTWTPYVLTVRNTGPAAFTGDVYLIPNDSRSTTSTFPTYRAALSVSRDQQRSTVVYVVDAPGGYSAELHDASGRLLLHADVQPATQGGSAVGILSDLPQATQKLGAPLHALSQVDASLSRFASAPDFPNNAVYLSGLSTLVIDQFDSAALSQAQVQALKDFVGLGGTVIEAGGPSWRRTLLSLPQELLPMRPSSTATASLNALAELAGRTTDATAQIASGAVSAGRVTLAAQDGQPLVVEGSYGAGRVVELAFDPFAEPFDSQVGLAGMAWAHAVSRALSGVQGGSRAIAQSNFGSTGTTPAGAAAAGPGAWAPGFTSGYDQIYNILTDTPATATPPVGLLGGLLVAYVMLVGVLNYLFMKAMGRRTLMWVSVPIVAVFFTIGAYAVGFGTRGSDFLVTELQVQRLGPEGAVESYTFDGVYAPRNGDVNVMEPANTLASTAVGVAGFSEIRGSALITSGARQNVLFANVAVWAMRPMQSVTVTHPSSSDTRQTLPIDAQLRVEKNHVVGRITNLGSRPLRGLELVTASGSEATLAPALGSGASATVDVDLSASSAGAIASTAQPPPSLKGVPDNVHAGMIRLASSQALSGRTGEMAVIGFTTPTDSIQVQGSRPGRNAVAAVVQPLQIQGADSLASIAPRGRLVSNFTGDGSGQVDAYDFDLPQQLTSPVGLSYSMLDSPQPTVHAVDVYDWSNHSWRSLPKQGPTKSQGPVALTAGETAGGVVRVRVDEAVPYSATLSVTDQGPGS
jgi:hypothetical protein